MSTAVMTRGFELSAAATKALKAAATFWFVVAILGQLVFAASVAIFYGNSAAHGNWQAWNASMTKAVATTGALQLVAFDVVHDLFKRWS